MTSTKRRPTRLRQIGQRAMEDAIIAALRHHMGNVTATARDLGVRRTRLYVLIERSRRVALARQRMKRST